eukprot:6212766-Pleurochrysis_carterae.AAC.4
MIGIMCMYNNNVHISYLHTDGQSGNVTAHALSRARCCCLPATSQAVFCPAHHPRGGGLNVALISIGCQRIPRSEDTLGGDQFPHISNR